MKRLPLITLISIAFAGSTFAGPEAIQTSDKEMKTTVAPLPTCDFSWTGFYIGGRAGYGWSDGGNVDIDLFDAEEDFEYDPGHQHLESDGFVGGGELGFNWQVAKWLVLGAETDFSGSGIDGHSSREHDVPDFDPDMTDAHLSQSVDWFGTIRGRIGFVPFCKLMIYGTGGFAYAGLDNSGVVDFRPFGGLSHLPASNDDTETGWTGGGGIEYAINRHWTIKVEYLYIDVGSNSATGIQIPDLNDPSTMVRYHWDNAFHTVTGGVNFKF